MTGKENHIRATPSAAGFFSSLLEAVEGIDVEKSIASLQRPVLVMHSLLDQVVGIEHASRIFVASRHPKSFISLDTADHLLTDVADANYASAMVAVWASRFLPPLTADLPQVEVAKGVVATETPALHGSCEFTGCQLH